MNDFTNEFDLARNFGFDITMSGGNMGLPAAAHQDYLARCNFLYKEFLSNMNILIKQEKDVKKTLQDLHKEKHKNLMYSLYRSEHADEGHGPFWKRLESLPLSPLLESSRGNTPWGLDPIIDAEDKNFIRPQTAPARQFAELKQDVEINEARPKTAGAFKAQTDDEDKMSGAGLSDINETKHIVGVLDPNLETTSSRKITVSKHSFAKVSVRDTNIKLKNREGKFLVKPMKDSFVNDKMDSVAFDPSTAYKNYDPINEKLALVRQVTSYKTPTIASDMKINNRVPIQKSLKGEDAKRVTVAEIYQNARDRRARRFKLVVRTPTKQEKTSEENPDKLRSNLLSVNSRPFSRKDSRSGFRIDDIRSRSRKTNIPNSMHETAPTSLDDFTVESHSERARTIKNVLKRGETVDSQVGHDSRQDKHLTNNGHSRRPESRGVVFATTESVLSPSSNEHELPSPNTSNHDENDDGGAHNGNIFKFNRNRRASLVSQVGLDEHTHEDGGSNGSILKFNRNRRASVVSQVGLDEHTHEDGGPNSSLLKFNRNRRASVISQEGFGEHSHEDGRPSATLQACMDRRLSSTGRRMSIVSVASAGAFIVKLQNAAKSRKNSEASEATLSFRPPIKVETITDTTRIVKQQIQKDRQLDERMAVWKRRMVNAGVSGRGLLSPKKRGGRLRMI